MIEIRSVRDVVRLLFIYKRDFLWAFVIASLIGIVGAFTLPSRFASEARLLVKPGRENLSVPIDAPDRQTVAPQSTQRDPIVDEEKILTGGPVVEATTRFYVSQIGNEPAPTSMLGWIKHWAREAYSAVVDGIRSLTVLVGLAEPVDQNERIARQLFDHFSVSHTAGSAVMEIRFTWSDARVAQRILDAWVHAYLDERARVLGRGSLVAFYESKSQDAMAQVDKSKKELQTRLLTIHGISAKERLETITERLNVLQTRRADATGELAGLRSAVGASQRRIAGLPSEVVMEREVGPDAGSLALQTQLAELKRQRVEALRTFTETAPAVRAIDESIGILETRARTDTRDSRRLERVSPNSLTTTLQGESLAKSIRFEELTSLLASYTTEASSLDAERQRVLSVEPELARMDRELGAAEKNSELYLDNLEKARIDQALDESRISNVGTIESATFEPARIFPKSIALLLLALPAGIVVGLLVVYLRSLFDQRIHDGGRIEALFGVKLWSTVKAVHGPTDEDSAFDASIFRLFTRLSVEPPANHRLTLGLTSARFGEGVHFIGSRLQTLLDGRHAEDHAMEATGRRVPGDVALVLAPGLVEKREALAALRDADLIVLVVEAGTSTVPTVEHAVEVLTLAYGRVDGIIVNRREFEIPARLLRWLR